jgi:hypothetical protein
MSDRIDADATIDQSAGLTMRPESEHAITIRHHYDVECVGPDGQVKWVESFDNLVVTAGRNRYLDATLKTGSGGTPAWYVGLVTGPGGSNTYAAGDTMASHAGWAEFVNYSEANRQAFTTGTIASGSVDNSAARAAFSINGAGGNVGGAFLADNNTKSGTTGILLGVGSFTGGDRTTVNGDTLNVTVTCSIAAS